MWVGGNLQPDQSGETPVHTVLSDVGCGRMAFCGPTTMSVNGSLNH